MEDMEEEDMEEAMDNIIDKNVVNKNNSLRLIDLRKSEDYNEDEINNIKFIL